MFLTWRKEKSPVHSRLLFTALPLLWCASACFSCPSPALPQTEKSQKTAGLQPDPKAAEMHESLGDALRTKGDLNGAMAEYRAALQLNPDFVNVHISLGITLYLYGDVNGALSEYQAAIRLAPNDSVAHHNLAATLKTMGDEKGAISEYQTASRLDPSNSYTLDRLASLYATASDATLRNPPKSLEYALQAVKFDDAKNPSHLNTLAEAYYVNGEYKNAVLTEKKALSLLPDDATRKSVEANLAKYELTIGEPSAGEALALPAVPAPVQTQTSERANAARASYEKGLEAVKQQDWNLAVSNFLVAQEAEPESPTILFNLGLASEKIPAYELRAIAWFQAYLLVAPSASDAAAVRNEVARLEVAYEAKNRRLLNQLDSLIVLAQKNVDQLSANGSNQKWADAARSILGVAIEFQAGSYYYAGDESSALHILRVTDQKRFQAGRLIIPALDSSNMSHAMVSAGFGINTIVNGDKSGEFNSGEIEALDYLLEAGDLVHAWTLMTGWKPNDDLWIMGMERFLCTAHDQSDGITFAKASTDVEKAIAGMADTRGYFSLIRLYLEMGEVARAEALAKTIPGGAYPAMSLIEDFHQGRIQSHGACPERILIFTSYNSSGPQKLHWNFGQLDRGRGMPLWWSTGRITFLSDIGRKGLQDSFDAGWDETRLGEYVKKLGDEILIDPYSIKNNTMELTRVEFLISEAYRRVRGPVHKTSGSSH